MSVTARPGVASGSNGGPLLLRSRAASEANAVSGLSRRLTLVRVDPGPSEAIAAKPRRLTSTLANNRPALPMVSSMDSTPNKRAPSRNRSAPRSPTFAMSGTSSSNAAHPASSPANSLPLTPRGSSSAATVWRRGSGGGGLASSRSSASRHQARRIAPNTGWVDDATTPASASSIENIASKAGLSSAGQ